MDYMFSTCLNLTSLDLSNFETNSLTSINNMFNGCIHLLDLNIPKFNTNNIENYNLVFANCQQKINIKTNSKTAEWIRTNNIYPIINNINWEISD